MRSIFLMPSDDLPSNEVMGHYIIILVQLRNVNR